MNKSLHDSPLLSSGHTHEWPYQKWISFTKSPEEFFRVTIALSGIPTPWLLWVENIVSSREKRGDPILRPLGYRISILWDGITLLQETKFICDVLENALRQHAATVFQREKICWKDLSKSVPNGKKLLERVIKNGGPLLGDDDIVQITFLLHLTFYEISEIVYRNWTTLQSGSLNKQGFGTVFKKDRRLRDKNFFKMEMTKLRKARNRIAHSNELFQLQETQQLYFIAERWLKPLDTTVAERVKTYRAKRPRFLERIAP